MPLLLLLLHDHAGTCGGGACETHCAGAVTRPALRAAVGTGLYMAALREWGAHAARLDGL